MKLLSLAKHFITLKWLNAHWLVGGGMLLAFVVLSQHPYTDNLRNWSFDKFQQWQPRVLDPKTMKANVAIIDIDNQSLKEIGQWPWSRKTLAKLVNNLSEYGVLVVGFDIIFSEPDRTSPRYFVQEHDELPPTITTPLMELPDNEKYFADAIKAGRVVLGQVAVRETVSEVTRKVGYGYKSPNKDTMILPYLNQFQGLIRNRPELEDAASGVGLFSTLADVDGVFRRIALIEQVAGNTYPSLSLEMLRVALGGKDDYLIKGFKDKGGVESIVVKTAVKKQFFEIPTDEKARVWVHFARYRTNDPIYVSAKDVLNKTVKDADKRLKNALVVVGTSAPGLKDIRNTPINGNLPGVEMHAQLLETILSGAHLTRPQFAKDREGLVLLVGGLMLLFFVPRVRAFYNLLTCFVLVFALLFYSWNSYTKERILIDWLYPSLCIFLMFLILSYMNYMREEKERQKVKTAFGHYVSPALLEELARNPDKLKLGGETRNITIMFSDIRGFTTISEQFDAEGLTNFINSYLTPMTNVIMNERGTIDKYMGDAIMAFWNAPMDDVDHAANASRAALKMQAAVKEMNKDAEAKAAAEGKRFIPINIGVGLNSGPCCVGNMGSNQRFDYSALGDDVNLASRLEGQSKPYGVDIVIGENTERELGGRFALLELDLIQVKGKTEPVVIYALLGDETVKNSEMYQNITKIQVALLDAYRNQRWPEAEKLAHTLLTDHPDFTTLAELYIDRIAQYKTNPPPIGWKGEYIATSK